MPGKARFGSERYLKRLILIIALVFTIFTIAMQFYIRSEDPVSFFVISYAILGSIIGLLFFIVLIRNIYKEPSPINITVLSFPGSGKTTFLAVLFSQLQQHKEQRLSFTFADQQTLRSVSDNVKILTDGRWLPSGVEGKVVNYRVNATIGTRLFHERYRIQISDLTEQRMKEISLASEQMLNKSGSFRILGKSQAVMFLIDSKMLISGDFTASEQLQDFFTKALQQLPKSGLDSKTDIPVALVFTKVDMIASLIEPTQLPSMVASLVQACKKTCRNFQIFTVSAIGKTGLDGRPPKQIQPLNVLKPLRWILEHYE